MGIWHVDACANVLWNSSTGFENYKECLEKVNLCIYTLAVVCVYNGFIIQTLSEQSVSAETSGILSTELMIFFIYGQMSQIGLYVQPSKIYLISDTAILKGIVLYKHLMKLCSGAE